jgi:hypothetical protein
MHGPTRRQAPAAGAAAGLAGRAQAETVEPRPVATGATRTPAAREEGPRVLLGRRDGPGPAIDVNGTVGSARAGAFADSSLLPGLDGTTLTGARLGSVPVSGWTASPGCSGTPTATGTDATGTCSGPSGNMAAAT